MMVSPWRGRGLASYEWVKDERIIEKLKGEYGNWIGREKRIKRRKKENKRRKEKKAERERKQSRKRR